MCNSVQIQKCAPQHESNCNPENYMHLLYSYDSRSCGKPKINSECGRAKTQCDFVYTQGLLLAEEDKEANCF